MFRPKCHLNDNTEIIIFFFTAKVILKNGQPALFVYDLNSVSYEQKQNEQTFVSDDLFVLAPLRDDYLNRVWRDFRKVVRFIEDNASWLLPMLEQVKKKPEGIE